MRHHRNECAGREKDTLRVFHNLSLHCYNVENASQIVFAAFRSAVDFVICDAPRAEVQISRCVVSALRQLPMQCRWHIGVRCIATFVGHTNVVNALAKLDGDLLASASSDNSVKVWNVVTSVCLETFTGHKEAVLSLAKLDGGLVASGSYDSLALRTQLQVWNLWEGDCVMTMKGHKGTVSALLQLDEGLLASGSEDHAVKVWDVATGECVMTIEGHTGYVLALAQLDGGLLAIGSHDGQVKLWMP